MLWYAAGYWYLGKKDELGKSQGWLCVRDPAPAPELVQSTWRVGDGTWRVDPLPLVQLTL